MRSNISWALHPPNCVDIEFQSWSVGHWVMSSLSTILGLGFFFGSDCFGASISWGNWDIMLMFLVAHNLLARSDIVPPHLRPSERSSALMVSALRSLDNCCRHENLSRSIVRFSILVTLCVVDVSQSSQSCSSRQGKAMALRVSTMVSFPTLLWCSVATTFRSTSVSCTAYFRTFSSFPGWM